MVTTSPTTRTHKAPRPVITQAIWPPAGAPSPPRARRMEKVWNSTAPRHRANLPTQLGLASLLNEEAEGREKCFSLCPVQVAVGQLGALGNTHTHSLHSQLSDTLTLSHSLPYAHNSLHSCSLSLSPTLSLPYTHSHVLKLNRLLTKLQIGEGLLVLCSLPDRHREDILLTSPPTVPICWDWHSGAGRQGSPMSPLVARVTRHP